MLVALWHYRTPRLAMTALALCMEVCSIGPFFVLLLNAPRFAQLGLRRYIESRLWLPQRVIQKQHPFWPYLVAIIVFGIVAIQMQIPLKVASYLSESAFDELADAALADPENADQLANRWAGLYPISGVEVIGKTVVLYVGLDRGSYGFARVPDAPADEIFHVPWAKDQPSHCEEFPKIEGSRDPHGKRIYGDWFVVYSYYWSIKIGWSCLGPRSGEMLASSTFDRPGLIATRVKRWRIRRRARVAFARID
jgi:hypothetical protein